MKLQTGCFDLAATYTDETRLLGGYNYEDTATYGLLLGLAVCPG